MKRIPDCPGGMGNANDWIKAREALGYPQNQTITYEYTTHSGDSDELKMLQDAHRDARKYGDDMFDIGYDIGFEQGYKQAIEDLQEISKSDRSTKVIKRILHKTKCPLSVRKRFFEITKIVQPESDNKGKNKKS